MTNLFQEIIVLREYNEIKEEIKNPEDTVEYIYIYIYIKAMETYCVGCKKNTTNKNSSVKRTKQNRLMLASSCAICSKKKTWFIKNQEESGLLSKNRHQNCIN